jgi:hypothetical protein
MKYRVTFSAYLDVEDVGSSDQAIQFAKESIPDFIHVYAFLKPVPHRWKNDIQGIRYRKQKSPSHFMICAQQGTGKADRPWRASLGAPLLQLLIRIKKVSHVDR